MVSDELMKHILGNLSAEGIERQRKHEYRQGYPQATEAEIQMLFDADKKRGSPPHSLAHAKQILGIPEPKPKPDYSSIWMSAMAWAQMYMTAKWDDTELALHASNMERKAFEAIKLGSSDLPEVEKSSQPPMKFVDWDNRPAVLVGDKAFAVLGPADPWCMVDSCDVAHTAGVTTEAAWRKKFEGMFGSLDLSLIARAR
jgi:hypothetical protein